MRKITGRSLIVACLVTAGFSFTASHANAGLLGSSVTGSLTFGVSPTNYFDPSNGFVPSTGYLNSSTATNSATVTIANPAVEFGFDDGANLDTANFTDNTLTITDTLAGFGAAPFQMKFTDTAFAGLTLSKVSDNFDGSGITASLVGNVLTLNYAGTAVANSPTFSASFSLTSGQTTVSTPEPGTVIGAGMGLVAVAGLARRRRKTA